VAMVQRAGRLPDPRKLGPAADPFLRGRCKLTLGRRLARARAIAAVDFPLSTLYSLAARVPRRTPVSQDRRSVDDRWMAAALQLADASGASEEVPVGAVVVRDGAIIASSGNRSRRDGDATAHAELLVLRKAAEVVGAPVLTGCTLYVTLEPCAMCAGAIVLSRVDRVVFGTWDDKAGMAGSVGDLLRHPRLNHRPEVRGGVMGDECGAVLSRFFEQRRGQSAQTEP